uniref:Uncharacterized protein n=1 Tax=Glossina pallidipes TaxID=7398 RepID=A0A1B0A5N5_GLOPL
MKDFTGMLMGNKPMSTLTTNNSLTQSISGSDPTSSRVQQKSVNFSPEFSDRASHNKKRGEQKMNNIKIRRKSRIANESNDTSPVATRTRRRASCNEINVRRRKASVIEPKCAPSKRNEKFENDINSSSSNMKEDNPNKRQSRIRKTQISLSTLPLAKKAAASKSKSIANEKDELFCNKNAKKVTFFLQTDAADDTILAQRPSHSKCQKNQQEKQRQSTVNIGSQTHNDGAFTSIRQQLSFLKSEQFDFLYNNCKVRCVADIMNLTLNQLHAMGICEPQLSQLTQISFEMKTSNENVNVNNNNAMNICKNRNKSKLIKDDENLVHSNNAYDDDSDSQTLLIDQNKCEPFDRGNASMKNFDKLSPGTAAASLTPADALRIRYEAAKHTDQIVERIKQNLQKLKTTNIDPKGKEEQLLEMFNELKLHEEQLLRRQQEMNIMELGETSCSSKKNLKKAETEAARSSVNISLGDLEPTGSFEKTDHNVTAMQEERLLKRQHQMIISEGRELPGNSKMNLLQDVCNDVQVEPEFVYASVDGSGEDLEEIIQQSKGQKEQQIDIKEPGGEGGGWSGKSKTNVLQNVCSEIQPGLEVVRQSAHDSSENSKESMRTERKNSDSEVQELNENFLLKNTQAELSSEVFAMVFTGEGSKELTAAVVKHNNNKSPPCETITSSTDIVGEASNSKKLDNKSTKMTEEPLVTTTIENEILISRRIKLPKEEDIQKKQQRLERNDDNECAINSNINNEIVSENAYAITTTMMNSSDEGKQKYKDESEVQTPSNRFRKTLRIKLNRAKILRKKRNCREDNKSGNQSVSEFALSSDKQCLPSTSLQGNSNIGNALPAAGEQVSSTEFSKINITKKPRSNFGQISDIEPIPRRSHGEKFVKEDEQISSVKCPKLDVIEKQLPNFEKTSIIDSSSSRMVDNLNVEDVVKEDPMLSPRHNNNLIDKQSLSKDDQENAIDSSKLRITEKKISKLTRTKRLVSAPITAPYDKTIILRKTKPSNTITTSFKRNESKGLTLCTAKPSTSDKLYEKVTTSDSKSGKLMITHEPVVDETAAAAAAAAGAHNNDNKERDLLETSLKCLPKPTVKDCRKRNNSLSLDELREQENELVRSSEKLETPTKNAISLKEEPSCSNFNKRGRITYDDNDRSRIENRSERSEIAIDLRELLNNKKYKASMRQLTMEATNSIDGDNERRLASPTSDQQRHEGAICQQIDSGNRQNRCTKQMMNETKIKTVEALPVNVEQQTNDNDFATKPESCDGGNSKVYGYI